MKKLIIALAISLTLGMTFLSLTAATEPPDETAQVTLAVDGMTCVTCVPRLKIGLNRTGAVHEVDASIEDEIVVITYDPKNIDVEGLIKAIESVGFGAKRLTQATTNAGDSSSLKNDSE